MTRSEIIVVADDFEDAVDLAAEEVQAGLVVGIPTDTVYVLAGDPVDPGATDRMFSLKGRLRTQDLSVLVGSIEQALEITTALPPAGRLLMEKFWPGPLTLVVPRHPEWEVELGDDEFTIGVRMSDHPVPLALCDRIGPLATSPAGVQGERVFETAQEVAEHFGKWVPYVLDGGRCAGAPPTVVDATGEELRLLRDGPIDWGTIQAAVS